MKDASKADAEAQTRDAEAAPPPHADSLHSLTHSLARSLAH